MFRQLGLIGCGLMGGSFALAVKRAGLVERIVGYSKSPNSTRRALELGIIDAEAPSALQAAAGSDLILLAIPVTATAPTLRNIQFLLTRNSLVMDVGSVKGYVIREARQALGPDYMPNFVPAHPIAGKEKAGAENAEATLFDRRHVVLTPAQETRPDLLQKATELWRALGSTVRVLSAERHDAAFAAISHLPHLLAFAFMHGIVAQDDSSNFLSLAGPGFADFSRIAASDPSVWRDVFLSNRDDLLDQLQHMKRALAQFEELIVQGNSKALTDMIAAASERRAAWHIFE